MVVLDPLGAALADQKVVVAPDIGDHRLVHLVAADPHRARIDDAAQRETATSVVPPPISTTIEPVGSVTGSPAPIAAAIGSSIRNTRRAPCALGRFLDRAALDRGRARRDRDDHLGTGEATSIVDLADEVLDHLLGDVEVGDHAVAQRSDGLDIAGRTPQHQLGLVADREHLRLAAVTVAMATTEGSLRTMPRPLT